LRTIVSVRVDVLGRDVRHPDQVRERMRQIGHASAHTLNGEVLGQTRHRRIDLQARLDRLNEVVLELRHLR
jgi:hypothetical protein